jgi:hypothetical protein
MAEFMNTGRMRKKLSQQDVENVMDERRGFLKRTAVLSATAFFGTSVLVGTKAMADMGPEKLIEKQPAQQKFSFPMNTVLTTLQLGKFRGGKEWLTAGFRTIEGFELVGDEIGLLTIVAPRSNGGSGFVHSPEGYVLSGLLIDGLTLTAWCRRVKLPNNFCLGAEKKGQGTKEPRSNGGGNFAHEDGSIITGLQWMRDRDGTMALNLWYRPIVSCPSS